MTEFTRMGMLLIYFSASFSLSCWGDWGKIIHPTGCELGNRGSISGKDKDIFFANTFRVTRRLIPGR
jgi:hypothetical protein